jgi:hydroxymethylpyrimidine/phosphomethylpyrimidine kinase
MSASIPNVLCLSGLDPTGGAGIQADIQAITAAGAHPLPIITVSTVQDTANVDACLPVASDWIDRQLETLLADVAVAAVKIGLLGDAAQTRLIARRVAALKVPVVCDPVLRAGGGTDLADRERLGSLIDDLLPQVTLLTPNAAEVRRLVPSAADAAAAARALLDAGCGQVLVTGGDEPGEAVINTWYRPGQPPRPFRWPRLADRFHGAGCTLAAAIAARLALGQPFEDALETAQAWTLQGLRHAFTIGHGRRIPQRGHGLVRTPDAAP